jgi:biopolymer transport protein TolQ
MPVTPPITSGLEGSVWTLIAQSGPMAKGVLFVLLVFSVVSWAIILQKSIRFRRLRGASRRFWYEFSGEDLAAAARRCAARGTYGQTPLRALLLAGIREGHGSAAKEEYLLDDVDGIGTLPAARREGIERAVARTGLAELSSLERHLSFLATTANVSPFIGLFGTVWGVMDAFLAMGLRGSTNLATVGPGIAEALIATVAGLAAAIPAVIGYNHFLGEVRAVSIELERFRSLLADRLTKE